MSNYCIRMINYCILDVSNHPGDAAGNYRYSFEKNECSRRFQESKLCLFRDFYFSVKPLFKGPLFLLELIGRFSICGEYFYLQIPSQTGERSSQLVTATSSNLKLRNVLSTSEINSKMTAETICLHHKFGHCKYRDTCRQRHVQEHCESSECDIDSCVKRHQHVCRFQR